MAVLYSSLLRRPVPGCPTTCELRFGEEARGRAGSGLQPTLCHTCALVHTCWPLLHAGDFRAAHVVNAARCISLVCTCIILHVLHEFLMPSRCVVALVEHKHPPHTPTVCHHPFRFYRYMGLLPIGVIPVGTLCYALVRPGRTAGVRAGCRLYSGRERFNLGHISKYVCTTVSCLL